ncbi:MAG TPA: NAD(P)H-binding protein [Phycisphaerales bacterium]|nr:NAD(P)H-binding protein [Phycisphaerales bacterium]
MGTKTVAVTGASGFVGRWMVRELLARGYGVRALVRSREKAREVLPNGPVLVVGDISDAGKAEELLEGCGACINLLGIIRETRGDSGQRPQTFQRIHVDATRMLVAKCQERGVRRFVQMSAINATDAGQTEYQRTKFEAEMLVRLSDLDWTIFRPSFIHGPDGEFVQMVKGWAKGHAAPYVFIPYFTRSVEDKRVPLGPVHDIDPKVAPVYVGDVAHAFVVSLENQRTFGEVYNLVGSETLSFPDMLRFMRDHIHGAHENQPVFGLPSHVGANVAKGAKALGMGGLLPFDEGMAKMGAMDTTASLTKFREHTGIEPAPFKASFKTYAGQV